VKKLIVKKKRLKRSILYRLPVPEPNIAPESINDLELNSEELRYLE
jgi:hypothetical protein